MTSEFAFVLGTGRCGSTLVHELVARHPDVGFLSNLEDRVPLPAAAGRLRPDRGDDGGRGGDSGRDRLPNLAPSLTGRGPATASRGNYQKFSRLSTSLS